jgi:hypothetical protein
VINQASHISLAQESLANHMACIPEKCHGWFCGKLGFFGTAAAIDMHQALVHKTHQKIHIRIS